MSSRRPLPPFLPASLALTLLAGLAAAVPVRAADVSEGGRLYQHHCASCHGPRGKPLLPNAPDFSNPTVLMKPDLALLGVIRGGRGAMPAYQGVLREREMLDVIAHLRTLR